MISYDKQRQQMQHHWVKDNSKRTRLDLFDFIVKMRDIRTIIVMVNHRMLDEYDSNIK